MSEEAVATYARARADLAGGTLDLWPLWCLEPGAVTVNVSLRSGVRLRLTRTREAWLVHEMGQQRRLLDPKAQGQDLTATVVGHFFPEGGLLVQVQQQLPVGSGLGGSSVYAVALARGCLQLAGKRLATYKLVQTLKDLEARVLGAPTGIQDYYPALLRGVLAIHLVPGGEQVERLPVPKAWVKAHLTVVYTGVGHHSGMVNWEVYRARIEQQEDVTRGLARVAEAARSCRSFLLQRDAVGVGKAIRKEWEARQALSPSVSSPGLTQVIAAGLEAGAWAAKACGAGGGGSVLFWGPPGRSKAIFQAALEAAPGASRVPV
ncbi:MAG: GHMP family kinase ATP-binding protein [Thermoanaerobaculaceae bacterium]